MTKQTDYGILVLTRFANEEAGNVHTVRDLADSTGLSTAMTSKILKLLTRAGLVESHRGVKGGYSLAREAEKISVADIIRALEGPIAMTECTLVDQSDCKIESHCPVRGHWWTINQAIRKTLEGISLASMTQPAPTPQSVVNFLN